MINTLLGYENSKITSVQSYLQSVPYFCNLLNNEEAEKLLVYDITGRMVYTINLKGSTGNIVWQTSNIPAGVYTYNIECIKGKISVQH